MKRFSMSQPNSNTYPILDSGSKPDGRCNVVEDRSGPVTIISRGPSNRRGIVTPRTAPIAGINMTTTSSPPIVGPGPNSIWARVDISVEVASSGPRNNGLPMPLDIVILLDNMHVFLWNMVLD